MNNTIQSKDKELFSQEINQEIQSHLSTWKTIQKSRALIGNNDLMRECIEVQINKRTGRQRSDFIFNLAIRSITVSPEWSKFPVLQKAFLGILDTVKFSHNNKKTFGSENTLGMSGATLSARQNSSIDSARGPCSLRTAKTAQKVAIESGIFFRDRIKIPVKNWVNKSLHRLKKYKTTISHYALSSFDLLKEFIIATIKGWVPPSLFRNSKPANPCGEPCLDTNQGATDALPTRSLLKNKYIMSEDRDLRKLSSAPYGGATPVPGSPEYKEYIDLQCRILLAQWEIRKNSRQGLLEAMCLI